jgi:hypothetical protein
MNWIGVLEVVIFPFRVLKPILPEICSNPVSEIMAAFEVKRPPFVIDVLALEFIPFVVISAPVMETAPRRELVVPKGAAAFTAPFPARKVKVWLEPVTPPDKVIEPPPVELLIITSPVSSTASAKFMEAFGALPLVVVMSTPILTVPPPVWLKAPPALLVPDKVVL